jgi:hypothetical protein
MLVITFSGFIVIAQHALVVGNICKPVFEAVCAPGHHRSGNAPNDHLNNCFGRQHDPVTAQQRGSHPEHIAKSTLVVNYANAWPAEATRMQIGRKPEHYPFGSAGIGWMKGAGSIAPCRV